MPRNGYLRGISISGGIESPEIKLKPKMDKPKAIHKKGYMVKDARQMLMQQYQHNKPDVKGREDAQPVQWAIQKAEGSAKQTARTVIRTASKKMRTVKQQNGTKANARAAASSRTSQGERYTTAQPTETNVRQMSSAPNSPGSFGQQPSPHATKNKARRQRIQKDLQQKKKMLNKEARPIPGQNTAPKSPGNLAQPKTTGINDGSAQRLSLRSARQSAGGIPHNKLKKSHPFSAGKYKAASKTVVTAKRKRQAQKAAQAAKKAGKATGKLAVKAAKMVARAGVALAKGIAALAAACGPVLAILIFVAAVAAVIASPFGIFFSKEDKSPDVSPVAEVVQRVSADFNKKIKDIRDGNTWDTLTIHYKGGSSGNNWRDVLAVFAVKTTLFDQDATDVVTIDEKRAGLIEGIFWDMNEIRHWMETVEHKETTTEIDADGNPVEVETITYEYILHIEITSRSAAEQADIYGFNADQKEVLQELVSGAYDDLFIELIGSGIDFGNGSGVVAKGIYVWPAVASNHVSSPYGNRPDPFTGETDFHTGIDIDAGYGTGVIAAADGRVVTAQYHNSYGNYIVIDHGNGNRTLYAHMSTLMVGAGQSVSQGQPIGLVGSTGDSTGPHLHFETVAGGGRVNPLDYFDSYSL